MSSARPSFLQSCTFWGWYFSISSSRIDHDNSAHFARIGMFFTPLNAFINGSEERWSVFIDFLNSRESVAASVKGLFFTSSESIEEDALFIVQPTACTPIRMTYSEGSRLISIHTSSPQNGLTPCESKVWLSILFRFLGRLECSKINLWSRSLNSFVAIHEIPQRLFDRIYQ